MSKEQEMIECAYQEGIKTLFFSLLENLATSGADEASEKFKVGLATTKKARELALKFV